jgi:hypothetical protein
VFIESVYNNLFSVNEFPPDFPVIQEVVHLFKLGSVLKSIGGVLK